LQTGGQERGEETRRRFAKEKKKKSLPGAVITKNPNGSTSVETFERISIQDLSKYKREERSGIDG